MNKKDLKYIKQIAERLPAVYEQTVSGYIVEDGQPKPNIVNHEINHVRRMRKAYEQLGMEGIKSYLEMIHKLQIKRNDLFNKQVSEREELRVGDSPEMSGDRSVPPVPNDSDPVQSNEGELGEDRAAVRKNRKASSRTSKAKEKS